VDFKVLKRGKKQRREGEPEATEAVHKFIVKRGATRSAISSGGLLVRTFLTGEKIVVGL
jgi:hypothetical protein